VRQVTARYFGMSLILIEDFSQFITVEDSAFLDPKSQTTGGRKYSFYIDDSSYALFQRCLTRGGRHDYVSGSKTPGPNVFVDSLATQANSDIGPHFRYATGELYDNIKSNNSINVQNRLNSGTSHGWSGAQVMFWNVEAGGIISDAPTGAMNWSIGTVGPKREGAWVASEPFGIWESENVPVTPRSLYYAQLEERLGSGALNEVILPQQIHGTIWTELESWDGNGLILDAVVCWLDDSSMPAINTPISINARIRDLAILDGLSSTTWSQVSGPGAVSFGDSSLLETTASFSATGQYTLQLLADNGSEQATGNLVVNVLDLSDLTPPAMPLSLVATPGFNSVSLDWGDNVETDLAGYSIYRTQTSLNYETPLDTNISSSEYVDTSALNGETYFYRVVASDVNGNDSAPSSEVSASPVDTDQPPHVNFNFPVDGASIAAGSDLQVQVEASDPDGTIVHVQLFLDGQLIRQETTAPYDWGGSNQNDSPLQNMAAGTYELEALALDDEGDSTSVSITITVVADVVPPVSPTGLLSVKGDTVIYLDWADNNEGDFSTYSVYRRTGAGSYGAPLASGLTASTYTDTDVTDGVIYFYMVTALDDAGNESNQSEERSSMPQDVIDFGTDSGEKTVSAAGFTATVPLADSSNHVSDAYQIESNPNSGLGNFAFLKNFTDMGGSKRSDFSMTLEARLVSKGSALNNNYRYGVTLFSDGSDLSNSGIQAQIRYVNSDLVMEFREGLNGSIPISQVFKTVSGSARPYDYPEGETYTMEVTGTYTDDHLDLSFTLGDGAQIKTMSMSVDATQYTGTYFGGAARIRSGFTVDFDNFSMLTDGVDTAPSAPSGLNATAGNAFVALSWNDNGESDFVGYNIYRSTTANTFGAPYVSGIVSSEYTDSMAVNGTTFFYRITAVDQAANESEVSMEVSALPAAYLDVALAAIDSSFVRKDNGVQDASETLQIKRNDWGNAFARIAYLRFQVGAGNLLGGIAASDIDTASLDVFVTSNEPGDTLLLYGLKNDAQFPGAALSESTWTGGLDGTLAGGHNLQGDSRPDGEFAVPNPNTTTLLGSLTFAAGVDTGVKTVMISDLAAFQDFIASDTNGEITLVIRGTLDGSPNQIASSFNTSGNPMPTLFASGDAQSMPQPPDEDGDGMSDVWEEQYFTSAQVIDGRADSDGDGVLDFFEYLFDSSPTDPASKGSSLLIAPDQTGTDMVFGWEIKEGFVVGEHYFVEVSTALSPWLPIAEAHYSLSGTHSDGITRMELMISLSYSDSVFLKLRGP
ncbi:MAG TPA: hypothetical protein DCX06_09725, partial [Opitutae bacterium]|nr:hypothetical protein [Opitutae bacterium]